MFEFIRLILPASNIQAESYYRFKKSFKTDMIVEKKLCHLCQKTLIKNKCPSESCASRSLKTNVVVKKSIKVVVGNVKSQLKAILDNHYDKMIRYKRNLIVFVAFLFFKN